MDKKTLATAISSVMASQFSVISKPRFNHSKMVKVNKRKPHQGKQERARRIKVYSPEWYSSQTYAR